MFKRLIAAAVAVLSTVAAAGAAPPPAKPKLVVAISVDQLSYDLYERYRPSFKYGLKRLGEGASFLGYQSHAATETCPGHSTILTGEHPSKTGIVANSWFDRKTGDVVYCVSVAGDRAARGPQNLRVQTFGDWLKAANPGARSYAVSGKDRAAIMMAGKHADGVYWWAEDVGFTTSKSAGPSDAASIASVRAFDVALFTGWRAKPPKLWPDALTPACAALAKPYRYGKLDVSGAVPPDSARDAMAAPRFPLTDDGQREFRYAAIFDPTTLRLAERLIVDHKLGHGPKTDVLAIGLSATDLIGHRYGNGGAEMCMHLASLDRALGLFLTRLDALKVPYVVALTADHGAVDAAERVGPPAERIDAAAMVTELNKALKAQFNLSYAPVRGDDPRQLFVMLPFDADPALKPVIQAAALAWLKTRKEVAAAFTADEVEAAKPAPGKPAAELTLAERFNESFDRDRCGDLIVAYKEQSSLGVPEKAVDIIAGHGSPWDYDRQVPILFWWPGATAKKVTVPAETIDIAPTLAAIAGLPAPQVTGKCLDIGAPCPTR